MRLLWNNYISSATTLDTQSEDANYVVTNIYDTRLSKEYRTDGLVSTESITVEYTGVPEYVSLVNHNVSSSATIYLDGGSSSGMSTTTFSETLTWSSYTLVSTIASTVSCDYFRVRVTGLSTATQDYVSLGYLFLGEYLEMPGMKPTQTIKDIVNSRVTISQSGQAYGDNSYKYRNPLFEFPYLTQTQRDEMRTMFNAVKNYLPVILIIWPSNTTEETPIYSIIDQASLDFERTDDVNYRWKTRMQFREIF
jgi:hypothetical protein